MSLLDRAWQTYREEGVASLVQSTRRYILNIFTNPYPQYRIYSRYWELKNGKGDPVMERDWDNLIVLDACRLDDFRKLNIFESSVESRVSLGSWTDQFLRGNFLGEEYHDTVYVTANPRVPQLENGEYGEKRIFHAIIPLLEDWNPETFTVMPGTVCERALEVQEQFPDKRLIIHFVQPHIPYIGKKAEEIRSNMNITIGGYEYGESPISAKSDHQPIELEKVRFDAIESDEYDLTTSDFRQAYQESLEITLSSLELLVDGLHGKTAITADHGEMFGEKPFPLSKKLYGHPGVRTDELCKVPWLEIDKQNRKEITAESPVEQQEYDDDLIQDRLEALGYT